MKRTASALTLSIVILFSTVVGVQFAKMAKANPASFIKYYIGVSIESPANKTYRTNQIILDISAYSYMGSLTPLTYVRYSVDGGPFVDFVDSHTENNVTYDNALLDLSEGAHTIVAKARTLNVEIGLDIEVCANVTFIIDTIPPSISVLGMENKTYDTSDVPLSFTVNETVSQISYSLDEQGNVTIAGKTTLTGLSDGEHNLTVYTTDEAGYVGTSETVYFSVEVPEPQPEPETFPITLVIATVIIVAVVSLGLLFYFRKQKNKAAISAG